MEKNADELIGLLRRLEKKINNDQQSRKNVRINTSFH